MQLVEDPWLGMGDARCLGDGLRACWAAQDGWAAHALLFLTLFSWNTEFLNWEAGGMINAPKSIVGFLKLQLLGNMGWLPRRRVP